MESDAPRRRGFLTERDREYLAGDTDIEAGSAHERRVRQDIRERTQAAIMDFTVLVDHLRDDDHLQIFSLLREVKSETPTDSLLVSQRPPEARREFEDLDFEQGLVDAIAFLYQGLTGNFPSFEMVLERGVRRAIRTAITAENLSVTVEFDVHQEVHDIDWRSVVERIQKQQWHELTEPELRAVLRKYANSFENDPYFDLGNLHTEGAEGNSTDEPSDEDT